ncbi:arsenate reductase ArsC [Aquabacter sp. CN5-332]|uniref:arsenate reductase ArsC n=1 Tax=Aquabacter sp. CN5-332 TaxID=3156608 RepID=UPI0032B4381C
MTESQDIEPYNVLFLCNHNAGRSLMAEAILNQDGRGLFRAYSAGTNPTGAVNPVALETLSAEGYPIAGLRSKNVSEFIGPGTPELDFIFTLCDEAAGEPLPDWADEPVTAHWGIEDPCVVEGSPMDKGRAFETTFKYLKNRLLAFAALPLEKLDHISLHSHLQEIGRLEGATQLRAKVG